MRPARDNPCEKRHQSLPVCPTSRQAAYPDRAKHWATRAGALSWFRPFVLGRHARTFSHQRYPESGTAWWLRRRYRHPQEALRLHSAWSHSLVAHRRLGNTRYCIRSACVFLPRTVPRLDTPPLPRQRAMQHEARRFQPRGRPTSLRSVQRCFVPLRKRLAQRPLHPHKAGPGGQHGEDRRNRHGLTMRNAQGWRMRLSQPVQREVPKIESV